MNKPGDGYDYHRADSRSRYDGSPLPLDQIEAAHESHTRRHEEEAEIGYQKVGHTLYMTQPDYAQLKSQSEQQHAYDARGHRHPGEPHHKLACSEKREQNGKLKYYHNKYNDGCRDVNIRPQ